MAKFISRRKELSNQQNDPVQDDVQDKNPPAKSFWQRLQPKKPLYRRLLVLVGVGLGGGTLALGCGWWLLERSLPDSTADALTYVRDRTFTVKSSDGTIIQQIGPATYKNLRYKDVPKELVEAFIAIEDRRFYQHDGVDYQGILRAVTSNLQAGELVEGGSTITQQLTRMVFLNQERSLWRKLREFRLAQKIDHDLSKEQILERYLNLVYLGEGAYGVADAAWIYFSKPVYKLTLPEMATLAALPPAPNDYSPLKNLEIAKKRRNLVLQRMQESGYITAAQAKEASEALLITKPSPPKRLERVVPYFTEYIQKELPKYVSKEVLAAGGLTIETTVNLKWQTVAEEAVQRTVERSGKYQRFGQAALVSIDPRNGEIRAMVGGKDFYNNQFNRVTQAQRQPGSTFKTFVYTTAIATGISPYRGYLDAPYTVDGYNPKNYESGKFHGWMSIRDALTYSVNIVAVKTLIDVGWNPLIGVAKKMGIESPLKPTYSLALGASEVNLLELTSAYGTLATEGMHAEAHGIRRILDRRGKVIYQEKTQPQRAIDADTAATMTWMLRSVVNNGTGRAAQLNRPVAGKTGTSDQARDLWFIGYIPQVVTGVWLGNDDNKPTWGASSTAAATWHQFMAEVTEDMAVEKFPDRPERLEGRKATIKAEPIKYRWAKTGSIPSKDNPKVDTADAPTETPRRSRRRRARVETPTSTNTETPRRSRRRRRRVDSTPATTNSTNSTREQSTVSNSQPSTPKRRRRRRVRSQQPAAPAPAAPAPAAPAAPAPAPEPTL